MAYQIISDDVFADIVKRLNLEDPLIYEEIPVSKEFIQLVKLIIESSSGGNVVAYFMPKEQFIIVKSENVNLSYNVKIEYPNRNDSSWDNFKVYLPLDYIVKCPEGSIAFAGWEIESKQVPSLPESNHIKPSEFLMMTTFESNDGDCGQIHTIQEG